MIVEHQPASRFTLDDEREDSMLIKNLGQEGIFSFIFLIFGLDTMER